MASGNGFVFVNGSSVDSADSIDPSLRSLALVHAPSSTRIDVPVPAAHELWANADAARERFHDALATSADAESTLIRTSDDSDENLSNAQEATLTLQIVLYAHFLRFLASSPRTADVDLLAHVFTHFANFYLKPRGLDVHALVLPFDHDQRRVTLRAFYDARERLRVAGHQTPADAESVLFLPDAPDALRSKAIYALFGGQGTNEVYFDELQELYDTYEPLVTSFLAPASSLLSDLATKHSSTLLYPKSLDPLSWLQNPESRPPVSYLASCQVSLPLMGLAQMAQYIATARVLDFSPNQFRDRIRGATGHSQGIVTATIIAMAADNWKVFVENALEGLKLLFYIGLRGTEKSPSATLAPALVQDCIEKGEGTPTPMLSVTGLSQDVLEDKIEATNAHLVPEGRGTVGISLYNGLKAYTVTGPASSLVGLVQALRKGKAESTADQSKVPFSKRLPAFSLRFLPISVPYHSPYLSTCTDIVVEDIGESNSFWDRSKLSIPVFNTFNGSDIRTNSDSLAKELCDQIFTLPIHWKLATNFPATATHMIDFGPGGISSIGRLTSREIEGRGIRLIIAGVRLGAETYDSRSVRWEQKWSETQAPRLVKTADGRIHLDTPFSRLLSKPPLMVAGMTPSTVQAGFNAAVLNAGYHIELAGGGHYNEKRLRAKVDEIMSKLEGAGHGLTLNTLYINPKQWAFQFPLWQKMSKEGIPVEGFCVAAGIPSSEKAVEIIAGLRDAGIKHVSFKPGSTDAIRQVVNIAAANPDYPVIMQWTGGRAGGHHSPEDFHQPLLATYNSIRQHPNLVLVVGSGFGSADDVWPYLSGEWSTKFGVERMPVDGFLFASRVMVAKEAHTSDSVKQLIVNAPGVNDTTWEGTYDKPTGGILSVKSELGEPIHKVATRGIKLWREFDDKVFSLPKEKQAVWLLENRDYVIKRLNADFQKPWFGEKENATPCDVGEMTYSQVLRRMVRLLYVSHEKRWIDPSFRTLTGDWCRRTEERLSNVNNDETMVSQLQSYEELNDPHAFLDKYLANNPKASTQILASEDVKYFLNICQRPGQKPVPFIPVLDSSFSIWFKKDSLWQAEDIEAVFDQDPERVCILQGPVAARHSTIVNEPIKDILGNIEKGLIAKLLAEQYGGDESKVPQVDYLAPKANEVKQSLWAAEYGISHRVEPGSEAGTTVHYYDIGKELPPNGEWLEVLAGPKENWLRALLTSVSIQHGKRRVDNAAQRAFAPRPNQRVKIVYNVDNVPVKVEVFGAIRS